MVLRLQLLLNNSNAISDTVSLQFEGGTNSGWGTSTTESQAFSHTDHVSSATLCLDLTNNSIGDTITMTFETDMFSYPISNHIHG